jgi:glycerol uptake facilitator-like aquaporin
MRQPLAKRVVAEALGTFFLLATIVGSGIMAELLANGNSALALRALHKKSLFWDFSVQPQCPLCLCGVVLLGIHQPQRHRGH